MKIFGSHNWKYITGLIIFTLLLSYSCEKENIPEQIDIIVNIEGKVVDLKDLSPVSNVKIIFLEKSGFWTPKTEVLTSVNTNENGTYSAQFPVEYSLINGRCYFSTVLFEVTKEGYGTPGTNSLRRFCEFNCEENIQYCQIEDIRITKLPQ